MFVLVSDLDPLCYVLLVASMKLLKCGEVYSRLTHLACLSMGNRATAPNQFQVSQAALGEGFPGPGGLIARSSMERKNVFIFLLDYLLLFLNFSLRIWFILGCQFFKSW